MNWEFEHNHTQQVVERDSAYQSAQADQNLYHSRCIHCGSRSGHYGTCPILNGGLPHAD